MVGMSKDTWMGSWERVWRQGGYLGKFLGTYLGIEIGIVRVEDFGEYRSITCYGGSVHNLRGLCFTQLVGFCR